MIDFNPNFSRRTLLRVVIAAVIVVVILVLSWGFILHFYIRDQLTYTGLIINSGILLLFLFGMARIVANLMRYAREEGTLAQFIQYMDQEQYRLAENIEDGSLIRGRYLAVQEISRQNAPVNHAALSSMLLANESTRLSFPRFVNNILILTGVFGTIIALSIALLGASDLLSEAGQLGGMDRVIHGMSTALSTTMTAILCYLFYGYFYLRLLDAQTNLISGIEQVTSLYLLPKYAQARDSMLHEVLDLIQGLREVADGMKAAQMDYSEAGYRLRDTVSGLAMRITTLTDDLQDLKKLLREGFRLPPHPEEARREER